ncbi:MAG TPA: ABC transporter permease [Thermoanaerobacterales bacterium]|nr:ABC transporter permease [Thermoanaerobacterales bacterium]
MLKYIAKRLLMMVPIILGVSFIVFMILDLTPGDPARMILGDSATDEAVELLREEMGLNDNVFIRYFRYIFNALRGDFGKSYRTGVPVIEELLARIPTSIKLATGSMALVVLIGIPVGIISAVKQYSIIDTVSLTTALLLTSIPNFWLGLMLILFFSLRLDILPATGADTWKHFILPSITLGAFVLASMIRMTRSSMLEVIRQDYIRTARAKGVGEFAITIKHSLKNALLPIITIVGMNFALLLGGGLIVESTFALPGIGSLTVNSIRTKDTPIVIASILFLAIAIGIMNLIVDIFYTYIDPRLKTTIIDIKNK